MPATDRIKSITVVPMYGKDYTSRREAEESWHNGKDFLIVAAHPEKYAPPRPVPCSTRDFRDGCEVRIRFKSKTKVVITTNR